MNTVGPTDHPVLSSDLAVDVCVVGGGITGLLTAWRALQHGHSVALLEQRRIVSSVTGYTTSKLTSQHGLKYGAIEQRAGLEQARAYGAANQRALEQIFELVASLGIDADLERRDAYVYAGRAETTELVRAEAQAAARAGLPAVYSDDVPLPYATHGAVVFAGQAQVHPRKLLVQLAAKFVAAGGQLFEQTKVAGVEQVRGGLVVSVAEAPARVRAGSVVLATLLPSPLGSELRRHLYCHQGYAVALPVAGDPMPTGMFINADRPMRSLRTIEADSGRLLQVGGSAYVDDPSSGNTPWDDLEQWGMREFAGAQAGPAQWRWTTQDYSSADGVPLIGRLASQPGVYVATGFGGWGLTTAGVAAELLCDQIAGREQEWHAMFDPGRELAVVDTRIISSHRRGLGVAPQQALQELGNDRALVLELDGEEVAAYRDASGELHTVSAACTHLGCIVLWEQDDRQWNCPCHGSRFAPDGSVLKGPASEPLPAR